MKRDGSGTKAIRICLLLLLLISVTGLKSQPGAILTGLVTNNLDGSPLIGAKISAGNNFTYSNGNGIYLLEINPAGTYVISCSKPGYDIYQSVPMFFQISFSYSLNISLSETRNPPGPVTATLDTSVTPPLVPVQWQIPQGNYDLIFEDGEAENFTVWSLQGNMNAVRFTPLGYPAKVTGGLIHIGTVSNYPSGSNPFVPFQVSLYDDSGPNNTPGSILSAPQLVFPGSFDWIEFSFPVPPVILQGQFFIVMTQGGNAPNAAGISIDESLPRYRSYSGFVTGGGGWMPAAGNFLMRALVNGPGGPSLIDNTLFSSIGYQVYRLRQGEEQNPAVWTPLGSTSGLSMTDNSWLMLPCGPYRWGVQAVYPGNRYSTMSFSNVLGKCWTRNITVHVDLSCNSAAPEGTLVSLRNLVYPDTLYNKPVDQDGNAVFPDLWKGSYELKVSRFGYETYIQNLILNSDSLIQLLLRQEKIPPSGLQVDETTLNASWRKPDPSRAIFTESWESGSFTTNNWTLQGGANWVISTNSGNPKPSAMFGWSPPAVNYSQSIVSRLISGSNAPIMKLQYDIFLDNHGTTTMNQMAVELWDGASWQTLKNYTNTYGDIHWTSQEIDISAFSNTTFNLRFKAYGVDSYDIDNWNIDNIRVVSLESPSVTDQCILGYNLYLENILCGFTTDTSFQIPTALVTYGNAYNACVNAVYGSGPSDLVCDQFVSKYLVPPGNLHGNSSYDTAFLFWNKPQIIDKSSVPPGLTGYRIYRNEMPVDSISGPDNISFTDPGLFPGSYYYSVSAVYDLTSYGLPGAIGESFPAGPFEINVSYGFPLPFSEHWNSGGFTEHSWGFHPEQGNWLINTNTGNPSPSAGFVNEPVRTDYSFALESAVLNASAFSCSKIWLDFDFSLQDINASSSEFLIVELYYNNTWNQISQETNSGNFQWTERHLDISVVKGRAFRVRFRAAGSSSGNISFWSIDNIHIYPVCKPPKRLTADALGLDVRLTWTPPVCAEGHPLDEGFEESGFPPALWSQRITNQAATWFKSDLNSPIGVHSGNFAARLATDYVHQDEWLIAENIEVTGDLTFWSFGFQGSVHHDHYYVKLSRNHGETWIILLDLSALPPFPGVTGYNQWNEPYTVDLSPFMGEVVDIAWQVVDGDGQGAWYTWAIDDCKVGNGLIKEFLVRDNAMVYDIYRHGEGAAGFTRINQSPVSDTTYLDADLVPTTYSYYITATSENCLFNITSDTVVVDVIIGKEELNGSPSVHLYPNPADQQLKIVSDRQIFSVEFLDFSGRIVDNFYNIDKQSVVIPIRQISSGLYIVRVSSEHGFFHLKVVISH